MTFVRAMCAIGRRGQLGLRGRLPWEGNTDPEYAADVQRFWNETCGHVLLAGPITTRSIPSFAHADRSIVELHSHMAPGTILARFPGRVVFCRRRPADLGCLGRADPALGYHPPAL